MTLEHQVASRGPRVSETTDTPDLERLFATRLPSRVLGLEVGADVYLRNGFRLVGASAGGEEEDLERCCQPIRNLLDFAPDEALGRAVGLGYETRLPLRPIDVERALAHLRSPRSWLLDSLFWPHLAAESFADGAGDPSLIRNGVRSELIERLAATNGRGGALTRHALAVVEHNRALAAEVAFVDGRGDWTGEPWRDALAAWSRTLGEQSFWDYLRERLEERDDPALGDEELDGLRGELPAAILGFHGLFARIYAKAGWKQACVGHLELLRQAPFPDEVRDRCLAAASREVVSALLTPLLHDVDPKQLLPEGPWDRRRLADRLAATLDEAESLYRFLTGELQLPAESLAASAFDDLASGIQAVLEAKLEYGNDERERNLLYGLGVRRRLLALPLSRPAERELERQALDDARHLYGEDYDPQRDPDPAGCWFLPGEAADPEASLIVPVHRITGRKLELNPYQLSAGVRVAWTSQRVLIPRSGLARACHAGKLVAADVPARCLDAEARRAHLQICRIETQHDQGVTAREERLQTDLEAEAKNLERALEAHDRRAQAEATAGEQQLAAVEGRLRSQLQEAEASRDRALAEARARGRKRSSEARRHLVATKASQKGLRGSFRLELPAALALILAIVLAAPSLESSQGTPGPWAAGIAGLALVLVWGRLVRSRRIRDAVATVTTAEETLAVDQLDLQARHSREVRSLEGAAEKEKAEVRRRLAGLERQRQQLGKDSEKRQQELRQAAQRETRRLEREKDASVAAFSRQIIDRLGVQPETARDRYPPLQKALAAGFRRGPQPGPAAMKMTPSEEMQARLQLAMFSGR